MFMGMLDILEWKSEMKSGTILTDLQLITESICGPGKSMLWQMARRKIEHKKPGARCKAEHVFQLLKNRFGYRKVRSGVLKTS